MIKRFFYQHQKLAEIVRFLLVGGTATIIDMSVMGIVLYCWQPESVGANPTPLAAVVGTGIGFISGLIFNYIFSILFVFAEKGQSQSVKGFLLFSLLSLSGLLIHLLGMFVGYNLLKINQWLVKIVLTLVVLVYNYITRKVFVFQPSDKGVVTHEK